MKPRACWPFLAKKAQDAVDQILIELAESRQKLEKTKKGRQRIQEMIEIYKQRALVKSQEMRNHSETANDRRFVVQLLELEERVNKDVGDLQIALDEVLKKLQAAEQYRIKMASLAEKDLKAFQQYQRKQEQKQMDALGITLFNLKT
jgi:flagellar export protein FliJ